MPRPTWLQVADVLRTHLDGYLESRGESICTQELKTLCWLAACRTPAMGQHAWMCDGCGGVRYDNNSCRNRHCPTCGGTARRKWLDKLQPRLLPVPCFQVVFTLHHGLSRLVLANRWPLYDLLFQAAWAALQELGLSRRQARLAALAVLHTWNQVLEHHPHVHFVVPAGGLSLDGQRWVSFLGEELPDGKRTGPYLVDAGALSDLFREKYLAGLRELHATGKLKLDGELSPLAESAGFESFLTTLTGRRWVVHIQAPETTEQSPDGLLKYLARYVSGAAISDSRLISHADGKVTFWARQTGHDGAGDDPQFPTVDAAHVKPLNQAARREQRPYTLSGQEFVRRFALHILPSGLRRIRYFGLYTNQQKAAREKCKELLPKPAASSTPATPSPSSTERKLGPPCPLCQTGRLRLIPTRPTPWRWLVESRLSRPTAEEQAAREAARADLLAWVRGETRPAVPSPAPAATPVAAEADTS